MFRLKNKSESSSISNDLNKEIAKKYLGYNLENTSKVEEGERNILIFGNHLENADENSIVCGTGYKNLSSKLSKNPKRIFMQRGPLTAELLQKHNILSADFCGEPGLLFSKVFPPRDTKGFSKKKKYQFGIICNKNEVNNKELIYYQKELSGRLINYTSSLSKFSENLQNCTFVISTSLDGIIFAHSYKIPALWVEFSDSLEGDAFEFYDYYANFGIKPINVERIKLFEKKYSINYLKSKSSVFYSEEMISSILKSLEKARNFLTKKSSTLDKNIVNNIQVPLFDTSNSTSKKNGFKFEAPELFLENKNFEVFSKKPSVSICTITHNRAPFLKLAEGFIKRQNYPMDLIEWVIIDDSEKYPIKKYISDDKLKIKHVILDKKIPIGEKRNLSHKYCNGEIIIYFDDDDYYPSTRVTNTVEELIKSDKLMAGSSILPILYLNNFETWIAGPYGKFHATGNTFAFKKKLISLTRFTDSCKCGEEKDFLKDYKIPMVQLDPFKTIIAIAHTYNTFGKEQMRENPKKFNMKKIENTEFKKIVNELKPLYKSIKNQLGI